MPCRPTHGPNRLAAATANGAAPATGFGRGPARSAAATPPPRRRLEPQSPRRSRASSPLPLTAPPRARRRQTFPAPTTSMRSRPPRLDGGKWSGGSVRRRSAEKHARRRPSKAGQPERTPWVASSAAQAARDFARADTSHCQAVMIVFADVRRSPQRASEQQIHAIRDNCGRRWTATNSPQLQPELPPPGAASAWLRPILTARLPPWARASRVSLKAA
jgi:hypothetical protein